MKRKRKTFKVQVTITSEIDDITSLSNDEFAEALEIQLNDVMGEFACVQVKNI